VRRISPDHHKNQNVTDNIILVTTGRVRPEIGYRISDKVRQTFPNPEPRSRPFEQTARSAFDTGSVVPPEYRADQHATNSKAWPGWEWKRAEAVVTGNTYSPPRPKCACCNVELEPARADARFCSNACRQKSYRRNKAASAA
jgi:hypothetical protein